uniref:F-box domain-containing protein n=1 Tax=Leersia perrieri TaxID=77586 RepID=A0A0D9WDC7_9ORYZ
MIYSSRTGVWSDKIDSGWGIKIRIQDVPKSVIFNGMLHVLVVESSVVAVVDVEGQNWRTIPLPHKDGSPLYGAQPLYSYTEKGSIDLSQGKMCFVSTDKYDAHKLSVWVLDDYCSDQWTLHHTVISTDLFGKMHPDLGHDYTLVSIQEHKMFFIFYDHDQHVHNIMSYGMDSGEDSMEWVDEHTTLVCKLYAQQVLKGNRPNNHLNAVGFDEVIEMFRQMTGIELTRRQLKNKWDKLKPDYVAWQKLTRRQTGTGWDHSKGDILGCGKFRKKPLQNLEDLKIMFSDIINDASDHWNPMSENPIIPQEEYEAGHEVGDDHQDDEDVQEVQEDAAAANDEVVEVTPPSGFARKRPRVGVDKEKKQRTGTALGTISRARRTARDDDDHQEEEKLTGNDDLLVEILSRVPYKSLIRSKLVSRRWRRVISDPDHRRRLPRYHLNSTIAGFFYKNKLDLPFYGLPDAVSQPLIDPSFSFLPKCDRLQLLASCNGLLLLCLWSKLTDPKKFNYVVCNPATKKWAALPESTGRLIKPRLGFDPTVSSHFHVFELEMDWLVNIFCGKSQVAGLRIYSSKTGV